MFVMFVAKSFHSKVHTGFTGNGMRHLIHINVIFVDVSSSTFFGSHFLRTVVDSMRLSVIPAIIVCLIKSDAQHVLVAGIRLY